MNSSVTELPFFLENSISKLNFLKTVPLVTVSKTANNTSMHTHQNVTEQTVLIICAI
jgi:hypothetical protein